MTETKHTPGPWRIKSEKRPYKILTNTRDGMQIEFGYTKIVSKAEMLANARLIASAPELLEALEKIVSQLCTRTVCVNPETKALDLCNECALKPAKIIIAKAKGEVYDW